MALPVVKDEILQSVLVELKRNRVAYLQISLEKIVQENPVVASFLKAMLEEGLGDERNEVAVRQVIILYRLLESQDEADQLLGEMKKRM